MGSQTLLRWHKAKARASRNGCRAPLSRERNRGGGTVLGRDESKVYARGVRACRGQWVTRNGAVSVTFHILRHAPRRKFLKEVPRSGSPFGELVRARTENPGSSDQRTAIGNRHQHRNATQRRYVLAATRSRVGTWRSSIRRMAWHSRTLPSAIWKNRWRSFRLAFAEPSARLRTTELEARSI